MSKSKGDEVTMSQETRKSPTTDDLLAWYIFLCLDTMEIPTPEDILNCMEAFRGNGCAAIHKGLYEEYKDFRAKFLPHDYVTTEEDKDKAIEEVNASIARRRWSHHRRK